MICVLRFLDIFDHFVEEVVIGSTWWLVNNNVSAYNLSKTSREKRVYSFYILYLIACKKKKKGKSSYIMACLHPMLLLYFVLIPVAI